MANKTLRPLHSICVNNIETPNQSLIHVRRNNATAYNGTVLVKIDLLKASSLTPEEIDILNGKFLHMEVWREMAECDELELFETKIIVHTDGIKKILEYSRPVGEFFDADEIVQDIKMAGEDKKRVMTYNIKNISLISKVFGHDSLHFSFSKGGLGTIVFPMQVDSGMFAVLAPVPNLEDGPVARQLFVD